MTFFQRKPSLPSLSAVAFQGMGDRSEQQDAYYLSPETKKERKELLAVLCDGMGGMTDGGTIARHTAEELSEKFPMSKEPDGKVVELICSVSQHVYSLYRGQGGCTLITVRIMNGKMWFWSVGDSELLLFRGGELIGLNCRHIFRNDLYLKVLRGEGNLVTALSDSRGDALTRYIGGELFTPDYTLQPLLLQPGDRVLLCTDGVTNCMERGILEESLILGPEKGIQLLESTILNCGRTDRDNYTGIFIQYG